jgi:hypothetical protein
MVAFNYRRVPACALARRLIEAGRIGDVRQVRAQYLQDWLVDKDFPLVWRLRAEQAGSGAGRPHRRAPPRDPAGPRVGDGNPDGVRERAAEEIKNTTRAGARLGVDTVVGFTGSSIWHTVAMFPPVPADMIERGFIDFADR